MEKSYEYFLIICVFFILSVGGAGFLFAYLESYAQVENPTYKLGGAIAGFTVIFMILFFSYSHLIAKIPASTVVKEAISSVRKLRGLRQYRLDDRGFLIHCPKNWKISEITTPIMFAGPKGENININVEKISKKDAKRMIRNPQVIYDMMKRIYKGLMTNYKPLGQGKIFIRGVECRMFEHEAGDPPQRQAQIFYVDLKKNKLYTITWTFSDPSEYERLRPIFERITSTFQVLN